MRHKYQTLGIVLARSPLGEASATVTLLTESLGLVRARAQGVRRAGAKLAPALATFAESSVVLVHGGEGWRVAGAVLEESWSAKMARPQTRSVAVRITGLLLRLVAGETRDQDLFPIMQGFFKALTIAKDEEMDILEALAALRILRALGLDAGEIPGKADEFSSLILENVASERASYIKRVNNGLVASGL